MRIFKNEQSGRSMIEMLGVLAIIGVLSVGGIAGYSKAMAKFRLTKLTDQVTMLVTELRTLYGNQRDFDGLTTATAINMGVGRDMRIGTTATLGNSFSPNTASVFVEAATTDDPDHVAITLTDLPQDACTTIASADWGRGAGYAGVRVTNTRVDAGVSTGAPGAGSLITAIAGAGVGSDSLPVSLADAAGACSSTTNTNTVVLWFLP